MVLNIDLFYLYQAFCSKIPGINSHADIICFMEIRMNRRDKRAIGRRQSFLCCLKSNFCIDFEVWKVVV